MCLIGLDGELDGDVQDHVDVLASGARNGGARQRLEHVARVLHAR
jgi:hypothetical protein